MHHAVDRLNPRSLRRHSHRLRPLRRLPWRCLRLLPTLMRRSALAGVLLTALALLALLLHAATGWWALPVVALAMTPALWGFAFAEMLGAGLDDPGFRLALSGLAGEFREWWRTTKRDLREAWSDQPPR